MEEGTGLQGRGRGGVAAPTVVRMVMVEVLGVEEEARVARFVPRDDGSCGSPVANDVRRQISHWLKLARRLAPRRVWRLVPIAQGTSGASGEIGHAQTEVLQPTQSHPEDVALQAMLPSR